MKVEKSFGILLMRVALRTFRVKRAHRTRKDDLRCSVAAIANIPTHSIIGSRDFKSETMVSLEPVADRVGGWCARRVITGPALDQIGLLGVTEEDEGGTIVGGLAVTGNLPSFLQHGADRRCVFSRGRDVNRQCK